MKPAKRMCNAQIIMSLTCHGDKHGIITISKNELLDGGKTYTNTVQQGFFLCLYDVAILYLVTAPPLSSPTQCVCVRVCMCRGRSRKL